MKTNGNKKSTSTSNTSTNTEGRREVRRPADAIKKEQQSEEKMQTALARRKVMEQMKGVSIFELSDFSKLLVPTLTMLLRWTLSNVNRDLFPIKKSPYLTILYNGRKASIEYLIEQLDRVEINEDREFDFERLSAQKDFDVCSFDATDRVEDVLESLPAGATLVYLQPQIDSRKAEVMIARLQALAEGYEVQIVLLLGTEKKKCDPAYVNADQRFFVEPCEAGLYEEAAIKVTNVDSSMLGAVHASEVMFRMLHKDGVLKTFIEPFVSSELNWRMAAALWAHGEKCKDIGVMLGVSETTVSRQLGKLGLFNGLRGTSSETKRAVASWFPNGWVKLNRRSFLPSETNK